jgi:hypothetical protein
MGVMNSDEGFDEAYNNGGKQAGTYIRDENDGMWLKQQQRTACNVLPIPRRTLQPPCRNGDRRFLNFLPL